MVQQNCQDEIKNSENPLQGSIDLKRAKTSAENFKANREDFQPTEANSKIISEPSGIGKPLRGAESNVEQDGVEARPIQGDFIYRHHIVFSCS